MTVPMIKSIGDVPYPIDTHSDAFSPLLTAGAALGITGNATDSAAWLQRVSTSDGPTTIRSIHGNTIVESGALVSVQMTGIETTGFNVWDEEWEQGTLDADGQPISGNSIRSKNFIPVLPSTAYYIGGLTSGELRPFYYDGAKAFVSRDYWSGGTANNPFTIPSNARYMKFGVAASYGTTYKHDICINLSDPTRNGTYEPHWQQQRTIPAGTLRSAGSVYDEQTATERIERVRVVDLGTLTWEKYDVSGVYAFRSYGLTDLAPATSTSVAGNVKSAEYDAYGSGELTSHDKGVAVSVSAHVLYLRDSAFDSMTAAEAKAALSGVILHYALATPVTTSIDPPLNMTYRTEQGGTERVMVPTGELSAPPTLVTAQGYTAESLRDAALATIAPVENGLASTNYAVGSYLVHGGKLCRVTTAIATGESITIGTNVTTTTVMAEVIALIAQ